MMKKRIVSLLLCIVMCLSLFPMSAFAGGPSSADYTAVEAALDQVDMLDQSRYTADSWADLQYAIDMIPYGRTSEEQQQVDEAVAAICFAIDHLVESNLADYEAVTDALNECKALKASDYTADSWQALQDAINGVIYDLDKDHQTEVDGMGAAIFNAIDALVLHTTHDFTGAYKDNGDGTHSRKCTDCDEYGTAEAHSYTDGVCVCGAKDPAAVELAEAMEAAISAIQEAAGSSTSTSVRRVMMDCLTAISQASTVDGVNAARDAGIKAIKDELSNELTITKEAALSAIQEAAGDNMPASVRKLLISCQFAINRATTVDEVNDARDGGIELIQNALAAAELDTAKKNAIAEINAKKNDENASVVDTAIAAIENAASVEEVTKLLNQASSDLDDLEAAKQRTQYKEEITNELLPAAECDEAREILNKALADLDNAATVSDLDSIMNNAEEAASDKDDEFRDWRLESNLYFKDALTDAATDETKAFVTELEQALADATSIAQVKDIFNNNKSTIDFYCEKDNAIAFLNECISSDESSDDMKAIARECLGKVKAAATADEFHAILDAFEPQIQLQESKDEFIAQCNEMLTSDEYSDETKSLIRDMISEVKAAETMDELSVQAFKIGTILSCNEILTSDESSEELKDIAQKILDETMTASTADECDAVMEKYAQDFQQQLEKDEAREEIKELLPENASDAVKKIISDACDEIQKNDDPDQYEEIIEAAKKAVEAQLQKEEKLAPVKEAAKKAIDDAVPADASDAVKEAAEKAKAAIDKAENKSDIDDEKQLGIDTIKTQIANEEAVAKKKADFKEKITNELLPAAKCDEAREILKQALADLDDAATMNDVNSIFYNAQGQANGKDSEFESKRLGYTNAFNSALTEISTDETKEFAAEMKQALADATSIAQVDEIYNTNVNGIGFHLAKDGILNGLSNDIASDENSDAMKAIAQDCYDQVKTAATMDELNEIMDKFSALMELQETKEDALAGAGEVLTSDEYSDEMKALAQDYIEEVKAAETMDELYAIFEKYDPLIELQYAKDDAREEVKELLPENASDAVKKIVSDACDEIQTNDDPSKYAEIIEAAKKAVEAQLQNEKELAVAKEEAKAAILAEQGNDTSEAVAKAVEDALAAIDAATTVDEVNAAMEDGIAAIKDAKAGNVPPVSVTYTIIDGANSTWTKGSDSGLAVRSDAPFAKFVGVKVDGKTIAATNYTAKEGSTIVTLNSAYLETLETGKYSIEIVSTDGSASTNFTVKANSQPADSDDPQTGDSSLIYLWTMIFVVSAAGLSATAVYSRKRKIK